MLCHRIIISPQITNPTIIFLVQIFFGISVYTHPLIALQTAEGGAPQGNMDLRWRCTPQNPESRMTLRSLKSAQPRALG